MKKNSLNRFDEGNSHSKNPLGGIPLGTGSNGKLNTVQEGETSQGDFIFSNDIKLTKDVIKEFNLPSNLEGKTISSATKFIDNKFKDREDKISLSTKNKMLDGIAAAQETIKAKQQALSESLEANSTEVPDMMNGQAPAGFEQFLPQNQMFLGGNTETGVETTLPKEGFNPAALLGAVTGGVGLLNQAKGGTSTNGFNAALTGVASGASVGSMFGPLGGLIGGGVGLGSGLIGSANARKAARATDRTNHNVASSTYQNDFALGGNLDPKYIPTTDDMLTYPKFGLDNINLRPDVINPNPSLNVDLTTRVDTPADGIMGTTPNSTFPKANLKPAVDWVGNNYGSILRYAPLVGNALELNNMKRPDNVRLNRLDNRFTPDYADERSLQNIASNEMDNTINSLTSATNGSQGSLRNSILAAGLNKTKALSDSYLKADEINRNQNLQGQSFNAGIDQTNLNQDNMEQDINDRNTGAFETNKSRLKSAIFEDLGNIGKEEVYKRIAKTTYGYNWLGEYVKNNPNASKEEVAKAFTEQTQNQNKLGGMLLKKNK